MEKRTKSGLLKALTRTQMKKVSGGALTPPIGGKCSDSNCLPDANGVKAKCPTGCSCDSAEGNPCYKP